MTRHTNLCQDERLRELCTTASPMISPFVDHLVSAEYPGAGIKKRVISYGLSSAGYDVRCSNKFKVFSNVRSSLVDPKNFDDSAFFEHTGDFCIIPANSFVLTSTIECFDIPNNVLGVVLGKSTYARVGVNCIATPLEPGWRGELVLESANTTPLPAKLYAGEGCAQILFFEMNFPVTTSYADRAGKYQNQTGVQTALT